MELFGDPTVALECDGFHASRDVVVAELRERGGILRLDFPREHGCEMSMRDWLLKFGFTTLALIKQGKQETAALVRL